MKRFIKVSREAQTNEMVDFVEEHKMERRFVGTMGWRNGRSHLQGNEYEVYCVDCTEEIFFLFMLKYSVEDITDDIKIRYPSLYEQHTTMV